MNKKTRLFGLGLDLIHFGCIPVVVGVNKPERAVNDNISTFKEQVNQIKLQFKSTTVHIKT